MKLLRALFFGAFTLPLLFLTAQASEQGFAVDAGSVVIVDINGFVVPNDQLEQKFFIKRVGEFDYYIARPDVFDGSETIHVDAVRRDEAGNLSAPTGALALASIDTSAPPPPQLLEVKNSFSNSFSSGFSVTAGAFPQLEINSVLIQPDKIESWFDVENTPEADFYTARPGVFDGSEVISVRAVIVDSAGNQSAPSDSLALGPIDTTAPGAPRVFALADLLEVQQESLLDSVSDPSPQELERVEPHFDFQPEMSTALPVQQPLEETPLVQSVRPIESAIVDVSHAFEPPEAITQGVQETESPDPIEPEQIAIIDDFGVSLEPSVEREIDWSDLSGAALDDYISVLLGESESSVTDAHTDVVDDEPELVIADEHPSPSVGDANQTLDDRSTSDRVATENLEFESVSAGDSINIKPPEWFSDYQPPPNTLAATNGINPFEVLGIEPGTYLADEVKAVDLPTTDVPAASYTFDLDTSDDFDRFAVWFRAQTTPDQCSFIEPGGGAAPHELLNCLDRVGYPQASINDTPSGARIDTGERLVIYDVEYSKVLGADLRPADSFTRELVGAPLSTERHTAALRRLADLGLVKDGGFDYYGLSPGQYSAELQGEPGSSRLSIGASLTAGGALFGSVRGRHIYDYKGLRYLDYEIGSDVEGEYELSLSTPIYYDIDNLISASLHTKPIESEYFTARQTGIDITWLKDNQKWFDLNSQTELSVGVSHHDLTALSNSTSTFDRGGGYRQLTLGAELTLSDPFLEGDSLELGADISFSGGPSDGIYVRPSIKYDSGMQPVGKVGLEFQTKAGLLSIFGDKDAAPADQRIYGGGVGSVRGIRDNYLGSTADVNRSGTDYLAFTQLELSKPFHLFDHKINAGVHLDHARVGGGDSLDRNSVTSAGIFAKTKLGEFGDLYTYLSKANSNDGESRFGIGIAKSF